MHASLAGSIEPLEPRIAPADLLISNFGRTAKWTDIDGDLVTLTSSKPVLVAALFTFLPQTTDDVGYQLARLDLHNTVAQGASLTFTARRDPVAKAGDGFVNVGWINAFGSDLVTVVVPGDLARLDVGDGNPATIALTSVTVHSAGMLGGDTQGAMIAGAAPTVDWTVFGRLGAMTVKGNFAANLNVLGSTPNPGAGSVGTVNILGDLLANNPALTSLVDFPGKGTGYIFSSGTLGTVRVAGDLIGGTSQYSGSITTSSSITSVWIGGTISGGSGDFSGLVSADKTLSSVFIGGSIISGSERDENGTMVPSFAAGAIAAGTNLAKVTVIGGLFGGKSFYGGSIFTPPGSHGKIGTVKINGILTGSTEIDGTGQNAHLVFNGIYSDSTLGAVKIGSIQGKNPASPVNIIAKGVINPASATQALAIASVTVVRGASSAQILAGFDSGLTPVNPDVQIGPVRVGNSFEGSSIAAGVSPVGDIFFGDNTDATIASLLPGQDNPLIRARIASVTIGSYVYGSRSTGDSYGIEAEEIGAVKIGGTVLPMTVRSALVDPDDFLLGVTHDFRIREL